MALRDEIKDARKDLLENGTFKEKISYFIDYYGLRTVIIIAVLALIGSFIYQQITKPDVLLNGIVLNVQSFKEGDPVRDLADGFLEYIDMNSKEYDVSLNTSFTLHASNDPAKANDYETSYAMMIQCGAGAVDFISSPLNVLTSYGYNELFFNLEDLLPEEEMNIYEPYLLYVDLAVIEQIKEANDNNQDVNEITYPDPAKPEEMEKPVPVFIDVTKSEKMKNIYNDSSDTLVVGIVANAPNPERMSDFLTYLFE